MAQLGKERIVGVDVCKDHLDLYDWDTGQVHSIANEARMIDRWLAGFSLPVRLAIEPTNRFHLEVAERAHAPGHTVYLIDGRPTPGPILRRSADCCSMPQCRVGRTRSGNHTT